MDNEIVVALIGAAVTVGNVVFTTLAGNRRKNNKTREDIAAGVQCLLRLEIIRSHEKYMERGCCPVYAREAITKEYNAYHNLGGNDVATDLYNEIMALPTERRNENE